MTDEERDDEQEREDEQAAAGADDRACQQTVPDVCDHGPVITRRDGKFCCAACAAEYDKAQDEYDRERAGSPWDK